VPNPAPPLINGHPACRVATPLGNLIGQSSTFPQLIAATHPSYPGK
jgi:hypothetical protein